MNALAAREIASAPPNRMFGSSTAMTISRPAVDPSFVLKPSGAVTTGAASPCLMREIHSADTTRRRLPSIRTMNSPGTSVVIGLPRSSTTVTSIEVTSTDVWNRGG